jgi:hypothetical protein
MPFRLTQQKIQLSENDVKQACVDFLHLRGYWCLRNHVGTFKTPDNRWIKMGVPGLPDYATMHRRYPGFFVEFKRPGAQLRPAQATKFFEIECAYRLAAVCVDSVEKLSAWLDEHEARARGP